MRFQHHNLGSAKLNASKVAAMRAEYEAGATQGALSRKYGIGVTQVARIVRNEAWQGFGQAHAASAPARSIEEVEAHMAAVPPTEQELADAKASAERTARMLGLPPPDDVK